MREIGSKINGIMILHASVIVILRALAFAMPTVSQGWKRFKGELPSRNHCAICSF